VDNACSWLEDDEHSIFAPEIGEVAEVLLGVCERPKLVGWVKARVMDGCSKDRNRRRTSPSVPEYE